jgi:hypothetical protein
MRLQTGGFRINASTGWLLGTITHAVCLEQRLCCSVTQACNYVWAFELPATLHTVTYPCDWLPN